MCENCGTRRRNTARQRRQTTRSTPFALSSTLPTPLKAASTVQIMRLHAQTSHNAHARQDVQTPAHRLFIGYLPVQRRRVNGRSETDELQITLSLFLLLLFLRPGGTMPGTSRISGCLLHLKWALGELRRVDIGAIGSLKRYRERNAQGGGWEPLCSERRSATLCTSARRILRRLRRTHAQSTAWPRVRTRVGQLMRQSFS